MSAKGDDIVQEAYTRVRSRYTDSGWLGLPPRALTEAIYREIREIDAERLAKNNPPATSAAA